MAALRDALESLPDAVFADLLESDGAYLIVLDLPGATADTVDVSVARGRLVVEARRDTVVPPEFRYRREARELFLDVEIPLPPDATGAGAEGTIRRGVLEVRLPKQSASPETDVPIEEG